MNTELTKNQIIEKTGISDSTYKRHLNIIKSHPKFSGYTEIRRTVFPKLNRGFQDVRYFKSNILDYFFNLKIKPKDSSDNKKYRSYLSSRKIDYKVTITPSMNKKDNIQMMKIIHNDIQKDFNNDLLIFEYNVEYDPNDNPKGYYHTHLLIGFGIKTNKTDIKRYFTQYVDEREGKSKTIEIKDYYGQGNSRGTRYFLKEGIICEE